MLMADPGDHHPLWLGPAPLVLASGSRTRFDLLTSAGIPVEVIKPVVDERSLSATWEQSALPPDQIALRLAKAKASAVAKQHPRRQVLGADQTLACGEVLLHKPADRKAAARQLAFLSGKTHQLHSAVIIMDGAKTLASFVGTATLTMRHLGDAMIERYIDAAGDAVTTSVGGYQLERVGMHLFTTVEGSHSTILGLPMIETLDALRRLGLVVE
jgi:septum formation protein